MDEQKGVAVLGVAVMLTAVAQPASLVTDPCVGRDEMACVIDPGAAADRREGDEPAVITQRQESQQAPPPAAQPMPPGRGLQWAFWDDAPYHRQTAQATNMMMTMRRPPTLVTTLTPYPAAPAATSCTDDKQPVACPPESKEQPAHPLHSEPTATVLLPISVEVSQT
jgi:hypothetical protein